MGALVTLKWQSRLKQNYAKHHHKIFLIKNAMFKSIFSDKFQLLEKLKYLNWRKGDKTSK
jgi:hypothetical protein